MAADARVRVVLRGSGYVEWINYRFPLYDEEPALKFYLSSKESY